MRCLITFSLFIFLCVGHVLGANLQCLGPNEIQDCIQDCPPEKSCENKDVLFSCANNNKRCQLKCVCKPGFYRIYNGDCVPGDVCDRCRDLKEVYDCGIPCDTTCATLNQPCLIANVKCTEKCYCRKGFARNDNDICIPIKECKTNTTSDGNVNIRSERAASRVKIMRGICGLNEEYQKCKQTCPPDTCISLVAKFKCASDPPCVPGCVCKPGYLRAKAKSQCMPMRLCPQLAHSPDFNP